MWRKLGSDDFARTSELLAKGGSIITKWYVCRKYELHELPGATEDDYLPYFLLPKYEYDHTRVDDDKWQGYKPFEDTPDLFLKFARLYEQGDSVEPIIDWVHRYGVLGLDKDGEWTGGPKESLGVFMHEVERAAAILAMYEAALSGDNEAALLACEKFPLYALHPFEGEDYLDAALWWALNEVLDTVWSSCYPTFCIGEPGGPSGVQSVWGFHNLLGAMYLQMYWLMAAGGNVTRCRYCGRIISLASPLPGARKVRQDKKFCDDACRQRHHYHTKTKLRRQDKSR